MALFGGMGMPHGGVQIGMRGESFTAETIFQNASGGRVSRVDASTLKLAPYISNLLDTGGGVIEIPAAGISLAIATNLITAAGADAAAAPAATTTYYLYLSGPGVSFAPNELRLSATAPTFHRGSYRLGTTGDALYWRFLAFIRTIAGPAFVDSVTQRFVINYYNRIPLRLFTCPGYSDNNAVTTFSMNNAVHAACNGGTGASVEWLSNGEDSVAITGVFQISSVGAADCFSGLEIGNAIGGTNPTLCSRSNAAAADVQVNCSHVDAPGVAGLRAATLTACTNSFATVFNSDQPRLGAAVDPPSTYITGIVNG